MNPKLLTRLSLGGPPGKLAFSVGAADPSLKSTSVRDQAALLLSISDIAKSEIGSSGFADLWKDEDLPKFPLLSEPSPSQGTGLTPRREAPFPTWKENNPKTSSSFNRIRSVSIDTSPNTNHSPRLLASKRTASPLSLGPAKLVTPNHSPISNRRLPLRKQSLRLSSKARHEVVRSGSSDEGVGPSSENSLSGSTPLNKPFEHHPKNKPLQGTCPKGLATKKIQRRKFSWKNYPELEQFLIANREEYLRHSALNYTVQQKQYNNRLTEELLDLATQHGYFFDEKEFSFVTVRDRIRCYYKSYVQSAKKRGVLMGYAARKAGLLTEDELQKSAGQESRIMNA